MNVGDNVISWLMLMLRYFKTVIDVIGVSMFVSCCFTAAQNVLI